MSKITKKEKRRDPSIGGVPKLDLAADEDKGERKCLVSASCWLWAPRVRLGEPVVCKDLHTAVELSLSLG